MNTFLYHGYQVPVDLATMTGAGPESFEEIANKHFQSLQTHVGIYPSHNLLEIGCGVGRDAIPLSNYIREGSYVGIDIIKPSIEWCQKNITPNNASFLFYHFDVRDQLHNPNGTLSSKDVGFPLENNIIDRAFLFSVFTHMFDEEIIHYLKEIRRVRKEDGLIYASTFIYDENILEVARKTNLTVFDLRFDHQVSEGCRINNLEFPLGAVAFTQERWHQIITESGLRLCRPIIRGGWSGVWQNSIEGQDVLILERA